MATKKSAGKKTAATAVAVIGLAEIVAAGAKGMFVPESVYAPACRSWLGRNQSGHDQRKRRSRNPRNAKRHRKP